MNPRWFAASQSSMVEKNLRGFEKQETLFK